METFSSPDLVADLAKCKIASGNAAIAACDRAISSGKLTAIDLAAAYNSRGVVY